MFALVVRSKIVTTEMQMMKAIAAARYLATFSCFPLSCHGATDGCRIRSVT